jgi:hypothetical protein
MDLFAPFNALRPKVGWCPVCDKPLRLGDQVVGFEADTLHTACGPRSHQGLEESTEHSQQQA